MSNVVDQETQIHVTREFAQTVCPDCLQAIAPHVEDCRIILSHYCPVTEKSYTVEMGRREEEVQAALGKLDYLTSENYLTYGTPDVFETVRWGAMYYRTLVRVNKMRHPRDGRQINSEVPCELSVYINLRYGFAQQALLSQLICGLANSFRYSVLCRVENSPNHYFLPQCTMHAGIYMGKRSVKVELPVVHNQITYQWPMKEAWRYTMVDFEWQISQTLPFRHIKAIRGVVQAEAKHFEVRV